MPSHLGDDWPMELTEQGRKPYALIMGVSTWKDFLDPFLPDYEVRRFSKNLKLRRFIFRVLKRVALRKESRIFVWGFKEPGYFPWFQKYFNLHLSRIEDGFIRSVGLGAQHVPPLSLCVDSRGIYFDPTQPSDLEHLLSSYDFDANPELLERARKGIDYMLNASLSKYNVGSQADLEAKLGPRTRKRILVLGQVEGDQSILRGCSPVLSNLDAVQIAHRENPDAQIIYKPHPEVLMGTRDGQTSPQAAEAYADVLYDTVPLHDVFREVDHVYTITSLSGFEALMHGLPVTCLGAPFYSGWGVTDDRQPVERRGRALSVEKVFAAAYILYPRYCNPFTKEPIAFEEALDLLSAMKKGEVEEIKLGKKAKQAAADLTAPA